MQDKHHIYAEGSSSDVMFTVVHGNIYYILLRHEVNKHICFVTRIRSDRHTHNNINHMFEYTLIKKRKNYHIYEN